MGDTVFVGIIVIALGAVLIAIAPWISSALVRRSAGRLPVSLSLRMEEEWLGELNEITSRAARLAFAVSLTLTPRHAFVGPEEESMKEVKERPASGMAILRDWKSMLIIPALLFAAVGYGASYLLPLEYESHAKFLMRPIDLPSQIASDKNGDSSDAEVKTSIMAMLSRDSLVHILLTFEPREKETMDRRVEELRQRITFKFVPLGEDPKLGTSIEVRYVGSNPEITKNVTQNLANFLLRRIRERREEKFMGSEAFLKSQLLDLRMLLVEKDNERKKRNAPAEKQMLDFDFELLRSSYKTLFEKSEELRFQVAMESRQFGGQLVLVETPTPGVLIGPNRLAIGSIGAISGLALGGMAIAGIHRKQRRALA